ncbi:glycerophosphodiester phosphodiesterase family protein [Ponticoccus alexandrii]|uniref:Phosphodiesterase n=1 Tax=Ponticoccus alexandrii TaxID=1943633 RepID=A0ABX7F6R1_9RHOB|nr:glycerophosphodiester phosphodiesterase family protein [Ponticoccus alexandrii]ETA52529.1 phosphodiesterase [Rhodobacteraceae bacterium PD-2]QRF65482.1 phosphodiesterase [Ponticoccus alexandrii]
MTPLPRAFLDRPIAHRALHDRAEGRIENSPAAIRAAIAAGYAIEIDIQRSADGQAMVFHDYDLQRLTGTRGAIQQHSAKALRGLTLTGGNDTIPTLPEVLALVGGAVPLLIEVKDQDGAMGPRVGPLEDAVAAALDGYDGPVALMSFNPHSVAALAERMPQRPRGLTTCAYAPQDWPTLPTATRDALRGIPDARRTGASFISHDHRDLSSPHVAALEAQGLAVLCWTIRSPEDEAAARTIAQNITFEGYTA